MQVEQITQADDALAAALARLLPQLTPGLRAPAVAELMDLVASRATTLLAVRDERGEIVGMLTLVLYRAPSGVKARIEDVVVDESARGRGAGEALTREAVRRAQLAGAIHVDLTSRPHREAAHRLYERIGFHRHDTNVFRLLF